MPDYFLRKAPDELWVKVKARMAKDSDGRSLRTLILDLLRYYADHGLPPFKKLRS